MCDRCSSTAECRREPTIPGVILGSAVVFCHKCYKAEMDKRRKINADYERRTIKVRCGIPTWESLEIVPQNCHKTMEEPKMKKRTLSRDGKGLPVARVSSIRLAGTELERRLDRLEGIILKLAEKAGLDVPGLKPPEKLSKREWSIEDVLSGKVRAEMIQEYLKKHPQPGKKGLVAKKQDNDDLVAAILLPSKTKRETHRAIKSPMAVRDAKKTQQVMNKEIKKALSGKGTRQMIADAAKETLAGKKRISQLEKMVEGLNHNG